MYKVFIQNRSIIFQNVDKKIILEGFIVSKKWALKNKELVLKTLELLPKDVPIIVKTRNPEKSMQLFFASYNLIEASGGIVKNSNKFLCIKRNGFWDIPKGKIDAGETPEQAGIREIQEECGITCDKTNYLICETFHTYEYKGQKVLKKTYWFALNYSGKEKLVAQADEGITKVKWLTKKKLLAKKNKSYSSIKELLTIYFN